MKFIKKILARILSQKAYLQTLHFVFYVMYDLRLLRGDKRFKYHYLIRKIIQEDYVVVDIGANLGYFAKNFSRLAKQGKVIAIEPVPAFFNVLTHFLGNKKNVEIHNVALGKEDGIITMVMPESDGFIRTGLPHIASSEEEKNNNKTQEVKIVKAKEFIGGIPKIDYIKCDIEGYELTVFECLGLGIPQVASYVGGIREYLNDNNSIPIKSTIYQYLDNKSNGIGGKSELTDPHEFALAFWKYFNNPELAKKHGKNGRENILKNYRWETLVDYFYSKILSNI